MKKLGLLAIVLLLPLSASTATGPLHLTISYDKPTEKIVNANLGSASNSFTIATDRAKGLGLITVWISLADANDSTTALNMSCAGQHTSGKWSYTLQSCSMAAGICTSTNASWTKDPSGITSPKRFVWRVNSEGVPNLTCTLTDAGGAAADILHVSVTGSTKGGS